MKINPTNPDLPLFPQKDIFPLILLALFHLYLSAFSEVNYDVSINRSMLLTITCFFLISIGSHSCVAKLFKKNSKDKKNSNTNSTSALLFLLIHFFISFGLFRTVFHHTDMHIALLATGGTTIGYHYGLHRIQEIQNLNDSIKNILSSLFGAFIGFIGTLGVYQIVSLFKDQLNPSDLLSYSFSVIILSMVLSFFIMKKFKTVNMDSQ